MFRIARLRVSLLAALFVVLVSPCIHAQTPIIEEPDYKPTLTFDVASIRPAQPPDGNNHVMVSSPPHSSRFEVANLPMKAILQIAYGFDAPIVGAPDWLASSFYNIQARSDEAADAKLAKLTDNEVSLEKRNAIRVLLADRLGLKTHLETRNSSIYNLVLTKDGNKMKVIPLPPAPANVEPPAPPPPVNIAAHGSQHGLEFVAANAPMQAVTGVLSSMVEEPVVNKTGLTGLYSFTLQFGRDWSTHDPEGWPSIFTAVQEQLGLKLESVHESVPNIVIDHISKPTDN